MHFRRLDVYRASVRFLPLAVEVADAMPPRMASLADQLRRASLSIPLNIAEGSGKTTAPDRRRFMAIARGSAMECAAILDACEALRVVEKPTADEANRTLVGIVQMLSRMCSG